ncbi:signal peptidase I [Candidatus Roizmanbacteria bacterium]|nr:signal peptidase I [Candidatus Roizmanbacteria bacterium]
MPSAPTREKSYSYNFCSRIYCYWTSVYYFSITGTAFVATYIFIVQPNQIKGHSMEPTYPPDAYVLNEKITYRTKDPKRGDIVIFKHPEREDVDLVSRIIGLPNETILIESGRIYINNRLLDEPYLPSTSTTSGGKWLVDGQQITVPSDHYFVMSDNRPHSSGSRDFGTISREKIIGRVFMCYAKCK